MLRRLIALPFAFLATACIFQGGQQPDAGTGFDAGPPDAESHPDMTGSDGSTSDDAGTSTDPSTTLMLSVEPTDVDLVLGDSAPLDIQVQPSDANITVSTADGDIVTVTQNDRGAAVHSLSVGETLVNVTAQWGPNTLDRQISVRVDPLRLADVKAGSQHACGLTTNGLALCWGNAMSGKTGVPGAAAIIERPTIIGAGRRFTQVVAGPRHTCAISQGELYCWGSNIRGQFGDGTTDGALTPKKLPAWGDSLVDVAVGAKHTCVLDDTGQILCAGANGYCQSGHPDCDPNNNVMSPREVPSGTTRFDDIDCGDEFCCGLAEDALLYCWGNGSDGQLGNNTQEPQSTPSVVTGGPWSQFETGGAFACAIAAEEGGVLYCWGRNASSESGTGLTSTALKVPRQVPGMFPAFFSAGGKHTCAVADGGVSCWGEGGPVTGGNTAPRAVEVDTAIEFEALSSGSQFTCGVTNPGQLACWGTNAEGQLGDPGFDEGLTIPREVALPTSLP
jgi:alpha-tubulin suppressor-like RCC1 family protein